MDTRTRSVIVLVLLFLGPVCLCWVDACAGRGPVETLPPARMRWVVMVTVDPNIIPVDGRTVQVLPGSDAVLSAGAREFGKGLVAGLRLDRAAACVNDLQWRLAILQPPRVTVLGVGD